MEKKILSPSLAFALCITLTLGASFFAYFSSSLENKNRFERASINFLMTLRSRMMVYTNAIYYTNNLFDVKPNLSSEEFQKFVQNMQLKENYPGIQTLGYIRRVTGKEGQKILKSLNLPASASVASKQEMDLVTYFARFNEESSNVLGLDLGVSPERKEAMNSARDLGEAVATSRVLPMLTTNTSASYAFLIFVPRYKVGMPHSTVEERRKAIEGFVYAGFRTNNLFGRIASDVRLRNNSFIVEVFDGEGFDKDRLMYAEGNRENADLTLQRDLRFEFANHYWSIRIIAPEGFAIPFLSWSPIFIFVLGASLSLLVALALRRSQGFAEKLQEDIQAREKAEKLLEEARRDADTANHAKSIFLANISHEIRTPLGVMIGFAEQALMQEKAEDVERSLKIILRNGKELNRIIGDVLDVSKIEANSLAIEKTIFSLPNMIQDIVNIWQPRIAEKSLRFDVRLPAHLPKAICSDETRIKQILTNLLSNAMKFTLTGYIQFSVEIENDSTLKFMVKDSGIGIAAELRKKLFIPFSQGDSSINRKVGGSGLGLALSYEIARALQGNLVSNQTQDLGSEFVFTLPFTEATMPVSSPKKSSEEKVLQDKKILVVEDSVDNQNLVNLILQKAGAERDFANDGQEGVEKTLKNKYDLVLMDIQMPNMDGYTAFQQLKNMNIVLPPVIALTAHALSEEREKALAMGFAAYVTKPIDRQILLKQISQVLSVSNI